MARWWIVVVVLMVVAGCSPATQTPVPTAINTQIPTSTAEPAATIAPTRAPLDRDAYVESLRSGMAIYVAQGLGNVGMTDNDGEDRTAMINYTLSNDPVDPQVLDVFDALAVTVSLHRLDIDAGTVIMHVGEDVIGRLTTTTENLMLWHGNDLTDAEFLGRLDVVNLIATREAQATTSAQPPP